MRLWMARGQTLKNGIGLGLNQITQSKNKTMTKLLFIYVIIILLTVVNIARIDQRADKLSKTVDSIGKIVRGLDSIDMAIKNLNTRIDDFYVVKFDSGFGVKVDSGFNNSDTLFLKPFPWKVNISIPSSLYGSVMEDSVPPAWRKFMTTPRPREDFTEAEKKKLDKITNSMIKKYPQAKRIKSKIKLQGEASDIYQWMPPRDY